MMIDHSIEEVRPCQILDWDSDFFGLKIAKSTLHRVNRIELKSIIEWCHNQSIDCLYFLADSNDPETNSLLQKGGFQFVDIRTTLERSGDRPIEFENNRFEGVIRKASENDIAYLQIIARNSHHDSRFYYDQHFPRHFCDRLYEIWIEKSVQDRTQMVFLAEFNQQVAGYISCQKNDEGKGQIGLFAVSDKAQGKGLGKRLLIAALDWFRKEGVSRSMVVTQGRNIKAQRIYQKQGFLTSSVQPWYHKWFRK